MVKHQPHRSRSRSIGYAYRGVFSESLMERLMEYAMKDGVIFEYDTGRGRMVWFNGWPGRKLRELNASVRWMLKLNL